MIRVQDGHSIRVFVKQTTTHSGIRNPCQRNPCQAIAPINNIAHICNVKDMFWTCVERGEYMRPAQLCHIDVICKMTRYPRLIIAACNDFLLGLNIKAWVPSALRGGMTGV